jgi:hypothetical protein
MKIVTADFGEMLKAFVGDLDPTISREDRVFATRVFLSGMQSGAAVLQNQLAVTTSKVSKMKLEEREDLLSYLVDTCVQAQVTLEKMDMDMRGVAYGSA